MDVREEHTDFTAHAPLLTLIWISVYPLKVYIVFSEQANVLDQLDHFAQK